MTEKSLPAEESIDEVIDKYSAMVYRLAFANVNSRADAEDIHQEVFLRYIRKAASFESEEHKKAWLIRVTINCSRSLWSSSWFRKTVPLDDTLVFEMKEQNELYSMVSQLPKKYRTVIHLFYYEDMSVQEISEVMHSKLSTTRTWLTRARAMIKEKLEGDYL